MAKNNNSIIPEQGAINIIGAGTSIEGDIITDGDIRIDGKLKGTLKTKGKLVVGQSGIIEGNIACNNADVMGKIEGKINVNELLSLKSTSSILGDIKTNKLAIEPNAIFSGICDMGSSNITMSANNAEKEKDKE